MLIGETDGERQGDRDIERETERQRGRQERLTTFAQRPGTDCPEPSLEAFWREAGTDHAATLFLEYDHPRCSLSVP